MTTLYITARNYASHHANRIHSDETALRYGFSGALVPGVAIYSYLIGPAVTTFGPEWLFRGAASVKFLKPVYDQAEVRVCASVGIDQSTMILELFDSENVLCAIGEASLPASATPVSLDSYPLATLPEPDARLEPVATALPAGTVLGSLEGDADLDAIAGDFAEQVRHPAFLLAQANDILARNVALGPWIHTASSINHFGVLESGEPFSLRARVVGSGKKRGHDFVTLAIAVVGKKNRPIAAIEHSALIRLREVTSSGET